MKRAFTLVILLTAFAAVGAFAQKKDKPDETATAQLKPGQSRYFTPESVRTHGTVTVEGNRVDYDAICGTIVVHPEGWDDAAPPPDKEPKP